jgi:hypothetical protein
LLLIVLAQAVHAVRLGQHLPAQAPIRASRTNLAAGRIPGAGAKLPQSNANANEKFLMKVPLGASHFLARLRTDFQAAAKRDS